jgi:sugar phosphate permease
MAIGMALIGAGLLWTTRAPVDGRFWSNLAGPFVITGIGTAFAFIPVSIAGLAGVGSNEAGLASGLLNTSQQLGGAIGVAVASTVAATHFKTLSHAGSGHAEALTGGFQWAFWVCGALALLAVPVTFLLVRDHELAEAVPMTAPQPAA